MEIGVHGNPGKRFALAGYSIFGETAITHIVSVEVGNAMAHPISMKTVMNVGLIRPTNVNTVAITTTEDTPAAAMLATSWKGGTDVHVSYLQI